MELHRSTIFVLCGTQYCQHISIDLFLLGFTVCFYCSMVYEYILAMCLPILQENSLCWTGGTVQLKAKDYNQNDNNVSTVKLVSVQYITFQTGLLLVYL